MLFISGLLRPAHDCPQFKVEIVALLIRYCGANYFRNVVICIYKYIRFMKGALWDRMFTISISVATGLA